jgi:uncharacterized protein YbgA (DUF1722 family)
MDINKILYDMRSKQTFKIPANGRYNKIGDFIADQKNEREGIKTHYNDRVEEIISNRLAKLVEAVGESRSLKEEEDLEQAKMG